MVLTVVWLNFNVSLNFDIPELAMNGTYPSQPRKFIVCVFIIQFVFKQREKHKAYSKEFTLSLCFYVYIKI